MAQDAAKGKHKAPKMGGFAFRLPFGRHNKSKSTSPAPQSTTGPRPWTAAEERQLKALLEGGAAPRAIALRLGRSEAAILAKLRELLPPAAAT